MASGEDERIPWIRLDDGTRRRLDSALQQALARRPWVKAAYLYGSLAVPGGAGRDLDIGLVPRDMDATQGIAADLAGITGIDSSSFDVRILNDATPPLLHEVLTKGRRVYEADRDARVEFEARAMSIWLDFKPVWERIRRDALERWSRG
jgi:predicted nucleotidyltransferase